MHLVYLVLDVLLHLTMLPMMLPVVLMATMRSRWASCSCAAEPGGNVGAADLASVADFCTTCNGTRMSLLCCLHCKP